VRVSGGRSQFRGWGDSRDDMNHSLEDLRGQRTVPREVAHEQWQVDHNIAIEQPGGEFDGTDMAAAEFLVFTGFKEIVDGGKVSLSVSSEWTVKACATCTSEMKSNPRTT
jgi:hypothetical protein